MKERIRKECCWRVRTILKTELNSANHIETIDTLAITVVTYSVKSKKVTAKHFEKIPSKRNLAEIQT